MTFGIRYSDEEKSSSQRTIFLSFLDDPSAPGGDYSDFGGNWSEPTGKVNITWNVSDEIMTYATVSRSYKSGGFNAISAGSPLLETNPELAEFDPEYINAIEIGAKTRFLDNKLQANITYFYYDYEDLQVTKVTQQTPVNENFDAKVQGFEGEFIWLPTHSLMLSANVAWLDTEFKEGVAVDPADINQRGTTEDVISLVNSNAYVGPGCPDGIVPCAGIPVSMKGNEIPNAPNFSVNLGAAYSWYFDNAMELTAAANYYWQDEFYSRKFNTSNDQVDEWDVINATLTLYSPGRDWYAEAWGRNLNDDDHITGQGLGDQAVGLTTAQYLLEPRTYGVTFGYSF